MNAVYFVTVSSSASLNSMAYRFGTLVEAIRWAKLAWRNGWKDTPVVCRNELGGVLWQRLPGVEYASEEQSGI